MAENNESFLKRKTIFQTLKNEVLEKEICELKAKLVEANKELERLNRILEYRVEMTNSKAVLG